MPTVTEGAIDLVFDPACEIAKYDEWSFYRNQFQNMAGGCKGIDVLARAGSGALWLIEVKDYRQHPRTKPSDLALEVAEKVRDTLAGLVAARARANDNDERQFALEALNADGLRVLLLVAQPTPPSYLKPRVVDAAHIQQKLRQLLRSVDPHPRVDDHGPSHGQWGVTLP